MARESLQGHVALVTGGSRGIGRATCLALAASGAAVAVNYRERADAADEVVEKIRSVRGRAMAVKADVAEKTAAESMIERAAEKLGPVDILVNNAGIWIEGTLLEHREEDLDAMWRTNVKGVIHCSQAAAPAMIENRWGRIVNVASNAGVGTALAGTTLYAVTKGAVLTLTRRMAFELGPQGITVNAVLPGYTRTDMTVGDRSEKQMQAIKDNLDSRSMVRRGMAEPEEIARVIEFLVADEAQFMTGQLVLADGGRMDYLSHT